MILTVKEAKDKLCCNPVIITENSMGLCVSDECMAWQKWGTQVKDGKEVDLGFCGLAGKPEYR
jgi:hypothetical protein